MTESFECRCELLLAGDDPLALHLAIAEHASLADEHPEVEAVAFVRRDRREEVALTLRAADERAARVRAEALLGTVEDALRARFGGAAVVRGALFVRPADPLPTGLLEQVADLLGAGVAQRLLEGSPGPPAGDPIPDPFGAMRAAGTHGGSYDLGTEDIVAWFEERLARARFHFVSIGAAHATVVFDELPDDVDAFAAEAYRFCPDLDSDVEELDDVEDEDDAVLETVALNGIVENLRRERALRFWWD